MKAALSLAYLTSFPSLGSAELLDIISVGTVEATVPTSTTVAQELIVALGRIQTTTASFATLNMASPLIKSLNLDLIMRRYGNPFDQFDLEDLLLGFEVKKTLEDIPELSDIAGKFVDKAPFLDYFSAAEYNKNQPMKKLEDIASTRSELLPFKVEKGLVDVLTFDEEFFLKWDSNLVIPHLVVLEGLTQFLYTKNTLQSFASAATDFTRVVKAVENDEQVDVTFLSNIDFTKELFDDIYSEDFSKHKVYKELSALLEVDEVSNLVRPVIAEDETDFEITTKKLLEIGVKKFKKPFLQYLGNGNYAQWADPTTGSGISYISAKLKGTGPITDRDTELAITESSRWHNNEFKGVGISFNLNSRLNDEAELDEVIYPSRIVFGQDIASAESFSKKLLHLGFKRYKRPWLFFSENSYSQRYSSSPYISVPSDLYGRPVSAGTFTDRDTELAVFAAGRWGDNEFKGVGPAFAIWPRLNDVINITETIRSVRAIDETDTVNTEHLIGRALTTSFTVDRSFVLNNNNNKVWSSSFVLTTQLNNSRLSERDTELLSVYAGRDQMALQVPYTLDPQFFTAGTDYILASKITLTKEQKAILEADISELFIDLKILNYGNRYVEAPWPDSGYWVPYAEEDTAFIGEQAAKFLDMAPFLDGLFSAVEVLPTKAVLPEGELFTASADIDSKNIFIRPQEVRDVPVYDPRNSITPTHFVETYFEFTAGLSTDNSNDIAKRIKDYLSTYAKTEVFRPVFGFDHFYASESDTKEIQKNTTEELLSTISDFYRRVSYKRDYQVENALADDVFSAFSQNYSSGYFSQAYVGETIIGD